MPHLDGLVCGAADQPVLLKPQTEDLARVTGQHGLTAARADTPHPQRVVIRAAHHLLLVHLLSRRAGGPGNGDGSVREPRSATAAAASPEDSHQAWYGVTNIEWCITITTYN